MPGERGERGEKGEAGREGAPGRDGRDGAPGLQGERGEKGLDGSDGRDGRDGKDGAPGAAGERGAPGERGDAGPAGKDGAPGAAGKDGAPGRDAFALEDLEVKLLEDGRTVEFAFGAGDTRITRSLKFAVVLDRGVYRKGSRSEKGDGVTYGGQFYIAQRDTDAVPGESPDWRLSVKRGRDGKDLREEEGTHG